MYFVMSTYNNIPIVDKYTSLDDAREAINNIQGKVTILHFNDDGDLIPIEWCN